ncbi:anhydro-N-acetylmuramic acid kinase [Bacillus sp. FJAT-50079]|uniref:anhydro-N-acetylmuramic acid kinase n=1 Tax=Bacillus sp. FJAT-50079 TaxID=2833577 RepID=UPI001BC93625|nr:anhydro-N-acetylmuramic acid kinase [Bacillus sp. FJAT-50079]MBS4207906.1 anhydro-N-acetylmuramic acid kinase [Bacillus sp. FJAT-50079]
MQQEYVVGLMSGTSLDGIDAVVVEIIDENDQIDIKQVHFLSLPYSEALKEELMKLCDPNRVRVNDISLMNMFLGELFAEAAIEVIKASGLERNDILCICSHGQTIFHQPDPIEIDGRPIISTLQIGDISVIAEKTGIMTIGDFRTRDMAVGGQGAPLVPYTDFVLFADQEIGRVLVNIGGISNITVLPKGSREADVVAYDTGPGNMIIDAFTKWATDGKQSYDRDGAIAASGSIHKNWLEQLLKHPYYDLSAPKSTGRELFGLDYAKDLWQQAENLGIKDADKIATVTELTAKSVVMEIRKQARIVHLKEVLVSGGGRNNQTLMQRMSHHLLGTEIEVRGVEQSGINADAKEAIAFALLGYQCYKKQQNNLPAATGATKKVVMGKIAW